MSLQMTFDPHSHYPHVSHDAIIESCGVVLHWVLEWCNHPAPSTPLSTHLSDCYTFGLHPISAKINNLILSYPGDLDLYPTIHVAAHQATFLMYPHAIVGIRDDPTSPMLITRMD